MTKYQTKIFEDIKDGALLKSTEGKNYKCWLLYPDGSKKNIRKDSAEKVCDLNEDVLIFGCDAGVLYYKNIKRSIRGNMLVDQGHRGDELCKA
jgi:hypothetical protein